ncbi:MAG: SH3 domain-containing protein [Oscillospiraceae bacterium]|jgi:uncharacterized protein YgiM (DUF1202 family)|nr:SH3 domain-containing protein [Oscillospiraceae bacterium]
MKTISRVLAILLILIGGASASAAAQVFVMPPRAPLLAEPSLSSRITGYIEENEAYEILSETLSWAFIKTDSATGYIPKLFIGADEELSAAWISADTEGARIPLRKTASASSEIAGAYYGGTKVSVLSGGNEEFVRVRIISKKDNDNAEGFISRANIAEANVLSDDGQLPHPRVEKPVLISIWDDTPREVLGVAGEFYHTSEGFVSIDSLSPIIDSRILASQPLFILSNVPNKSVQWIDTGYGGICAVRVIDASGETKQIITAVCAAAPTSPQSLIIEDVNFDGAADIRIATAQGGETPARDSSGASERESVERASVPSTYRYSFFIYDAKSDSFNSSVEYDLLGFAPEFDAAAKKIHALSDDGAGNLIGMEYDVIGGLPVRSEGSVDSADYEE